MTHICIYSEKEKKIELVKEIVDGAKVKDEVRIAKGDEARADIPLAEYDIARYETDCRCRGGDWAVYSGAVPFSWDIINQTEVAL